MTFRLALRALLAKPVRSAVLAGGFGFGIAVMAVLLGVGQVILEQARSPDLHGHGDVLIVSETRALEQGRFHAASLRRQQGLGPQIETISPGAADRLYVVGTSGVRAVDGSAGIPSLERALGDPIASRIDAWRDAPGDAAWTAPDPDDLFRALDRFHAPPSLPGYDESWAEWLYFKGAAGGATFYLSFLYGPVEEDGTRGAVVSLQLDDGGGMRCYADGGRFDAARVLETAPDVDIGANRIRIADGAYRVRLALYESDCAGGPAGARFDPALGVALDGGLTLGASLEKAVPPFVLRGARGWLSGYVVPVLEGPLAGTLRVGGRDVPFDGGIGYHDHNWGFWRDVTWQWGQVAGDGVSIVYGRVHPPPDIADPERSPAFLGVIGPDGPAGFSADATIEEVDAPGTDRPERIRVTGAGASFDLELDFAVETLARSPVGSGTAAAEAGGTEFLQMHGPYTVRGRVGGREVAFESRGAAETFRER